MASASPSGVVLVVANGTAEAGRERARQLGPVQRRQAETGAAAGGRGLARRRAARRGE